MSFKGRKKDEQERNYVKVDSVITKLNAYYDRGYNLFNIYHFRNKDDLVIQLKDGDGESISLRFNCTYPVYRFETAELPSEANIFKSLYLMEKSSCKKYYVRADTINAIGKLDTKAKEANEVFPPQKYLTYNVLRPEYYVTTLCKKENHLPFEKTRIGSLDIEVHSETDFPEPSKADHPVSLLTIFESSNLTANVFYLDGHDIDDNIDRIIEKIHKNMPDLDLDIDIQLTKFDDELELLKTTIDFMNKNLDIVVGWNVNEYDIAYIINRAKKLGAFFKFGVVYDGFNQSYVFDHFVCIDYISVYKFFVKKNPPSLKLADIAKENIGFSKIQTDTFLDIAYNITDTILVHLLDQKLSLINQMFSFKENGALLHVFNVRNALEPLFIRLASNQNSVFIANQFTMYYNIYYNEVYKYINQGLLKLESTDLHFGSLGNMTNFLCSLSSHKKLLDFYLKSDDGDDKKETETREDSAGTVLSKMVESVFKKKRKKKNDDSTNEPINISELTGSKNFDYNTEEFDDILFKLYGININTIFGYPGAFNKSFRGVSNNLIDLDFFSMYPVIIYGLNISIETGRFLAPLKLNILRVYDKKLYEEYVNSLDKKEAIIYNLKKDAIYGMNINELERDCYNNDNIIANSGMIFRKEVGSIPRICKLFLEIRANYKNKMAAAQDPVEKSKYNIYQLLYKVYNNSIYGYMGYKYSVIFNRLLVASVTIMGRSEILFANHKIISFLGNSDDKTAESTVSS